LAELDALSLCKPRLLPAGTTHIKPLVFMHMRSRMKISRGGQVSIPAPIRRRWATSTVAIRDEGTRIVLEPAPDDPIAAAEGALAGELDGLELGRLRRVAREDERRAEARRRSP
jgi:bifunctional DNA-binding transcriptional regulator/antitoxin component of YhaV-PrlF toxin-antitoxin module